MDLKKKYINLKQKINDNAPELIVVGSAIAVTTISLAIVKMTLSEETPATIIRGEDYVDTCLSDNKQIMVTVTDAGLSELQAGVTNLFRFGNDVLALHKIDNPTE